MAENVKKEIKKAMEIIDQMSMDEKEWELYRSREMAIMDYEVNMHKSKEEGLEEGLQKGRKELKTKQLEIAKKLLSKNMPIDEILEITELTKEEIESLQNQK